MFACSSILRLHAGGRQGRRPGVICPSPRPSAAPAVRSLVAPGCCWSPWPGCAGLGCRRDSGGWGWRSRHRDLGITQLRWTRRNLRVLVRALQRAM